MLKRFAFGPVLVIASLGVIFVGLDVLDILEVYELPLPIPIFNTVFISGIAAPVAYVTTRRWAVTASPQALWLGGGVLAFGVGSLLYGWLPGPQLREVNGFFRVSEKPPPYAVWCGPEGGRTPSRLQHAGDERLFAELLRAARRVVEEEVEFVCQVAEAK